MIIISAIILILFVCLNLFGYKTFDWVGCIALALPVVFFAVVYNAEKEQRKELTALGIILTVLYALFMVFILGHFIVFLLEHDTGYDEEAFRMASSWLWA